MGSSGVIGGQYSCGQDSGRGKGIGDRRRLCQCGSDDRSLGLAQIHRRVAENLDDRYSGRVNDHRTEYKVGDFLEWQRGGQLQLSPAFQRRSVWKKGAKSFLIDTILRGYPTPPVFLRDLPSNLKTLKSEREVVDGQQRLRTVFSFIDPDCLDDYMPESDDFTILKAHDATIAGLRFNDFPKSLKQSVLDYKFTATVFSADTEDREILTIFARMNATGVRLNDQELRNAEYYGEFKTCSFSLATKYLDFWIDNRIFGHGQIARMKEVELTSDLIILIINGISGKSKSTIDKFYRDYDDEMPGRMEIERRFDSVIELISSASPDLPAAFQKTTYFYALFASVYDMAWGLKSPTTKMKRASVADSAVRNLIARGEEVANGTAPPTVLRAATTRTTHASSRSILIHHMRGQ